MHLPPPFHVTTADIGSIALISVAGELDLSTKDDLEEPLTTAQEDGATSAILDLSAVSFIDSTSIGVIIHQTRSFERDGGRLLVVSHDPRIGRVFELTGGDRICALVTTLQAALEELVPDRTPRPRVAA